MLPVPMNSSAGKGRTLEMPGGLTAIGATAISSPCCRTVGMNSLRSPARCRHQVDSHSQVRNRQSESLCASRASHSWLMPMRRRVSSTISTDTRSWSFSKAAPAAPLQPEEPMACAGAAGPMVRCTIHLPVWSGRRRPDGSPPGCAGSWSGPGTTRRRRGGIWTL